MKRITAMLLSLVMLIASFSVNSLPVYAQQLTSIEKTQLGSTDTYYEFDAETKTLTISGHGDTPNFVNNSSSQPWYLWRSDGSIENVVVEEGVTSLGNYFLYCVCAADISLPSTLTKIGSYALAGNNIATQIDLGESITTISNNAFYMCIALESIRIPSRVSYIGTSAFEQCTALDMVEFGSMNMSVTISSRAFLACESLKSINIPKNATLNSYSIGYASAKITDTYDDMVMGVYKESKAYTYAIQNVINYIILDSMVIREGDIINCISYSNTQSEEMKYYFTPLSSTYYTFSSSGDVDVSCVLTDSNGNIVASNDDISDQDLNFSICCMLDAGEEYCYTVTTIYSEGDYSLSLISSEPISITIDWNINIPADRIPDGELDILSIISTLTVDFTYQSGYVFSMPFSEGAEYSGYTLNYENRLNSRVNCGVNIDAIKVGELTLEFEIIVTHCYVDEIVEPTTYVEGYTEHTCVLCKRSYKSDYVDCLAEVYYGRVIILDKPGGNGFANAPVPNTYIYDLDGRELGVTDENGYFYILGYQKIIVAGLIGPARVIDLTTGNSDLGDIPIFFCDYTEDGYVNAKDLGELHFVYGEYDPDEEILATIDINKDGIINYDDWEYSLNFATYGKIDESIYDNAE